MGDGNPENVYAATHIAGMHEQILGLPQGYETVVGASGVALSGGQRQRIGLARAVYGNPRFVVLDEPNSNLDTDGEAALIEALKHLKQSETTVVVIAHRPSVLRHVGQVHKIGSRDEVFAELTPSRRQTSKKKQTLRDALATRTKEQVAAG